MAGLWTITAIAIVVIIIAMLCQILIWSVRYKRVPPNKAMVIYGARYSGRNRKGYRALTGGGKFIMPVVESYKFLPLDVKNIRLDLKGVKTADKAPGNRVDLKVDANIKIGSDPISLDAAAEQLMDKNDAELKDIGSGIIEAHTKGLTITMKKNKIENDRETLAEKIQLMSARDLRNMGLEIRSLVIKEVK